MVKFPIDWRIKLQACSTKFSRGNVDPFTPFLTTEGIPPTSLVTTGIPNELASAITTGTQSALDGSTKKCDSATSLANIDLSSRVFLGMKPLIETKSGISP